MYIERLLHGALNKALHSFPAVLVTGPRQSGKTTLLRHELSNKQVDYVTFDDLLERDFARQDPKGFLARFQKHPVILDEIQYVPELLPYIKIRIDQDRTKHGFWILTGSQQFQLMHNVSESLAGRIAILSLLPFSLLELKEHSQNLASSLWYGCYPEQVINQNHEARELWLRSYVQTYIERDLRQLQHIHDLGMFERFVALMASRHSQIFQAADLARDLGISAPTIKNWANLLEVAYICYFLQPYFKNYGKRLVKSSKIYFIDSALAVFLTRQPSSDSILSGAMGGAFFEGLVVSEALKVFASLGKKEDIFFWRSHDGLEVDLIIRARNKFYPIEIKMTATPGTWHLLPMEKFKKIASNDVGEIGIIVCNVPKKTAMPHGNIALPWFEFSNWLYEMLK